MENRLIFLGVMLAAGAVAAGSMSSMTVSSYFDNGEVPAVRVVGAGDNVSVGASGDWFDSGTCELLVDGISVGVSDGPLVYSLLSGDGDTWKSYRLTLKSAEGEIEKVLTFFPTADFTCALHSLSVKDSMLDTTPDGKPRKVRHGALIPVAWSGKWNADATGAEVKLYSGYGTEGTPVDLVCAEGQGEGDAYVGGKEIPLASGHYTLTHFDGVETLTAYLSVRNGGVVFILR